MRILITGGTGQIGSRLAWALYNLKHKVTVLDRTINKPSYIQGLIKEKKIDVICADLDYYVSRNRSKFKHYDVVFHLAADITNTSDPKKAWSALRSHVNATSNLLRYLKRPGYICYASSVMVYGKQNKLPISESASCNPYNYYGIGKLAAEKILGMFCREHKIPLSMLRISSVYGKMDFDLNLSRAIPAFISMAKNDRPMSIYGDGSNIRDYVYIDDVIEAFILCLEKKPEGVFNISSGTATSILHLAKYIKEISEKDIPITFIDKPMEHNAVYDISKAKDILKYEPAVDIKEGLKEVFK
jgi:UDP-glucose 4-epimerase